MTPAADLLAELRGLGIELQPHGESLRFRPRDKMTPDLISRLQAHKPELLEILTSNAPAAECDPPAPAPRTECPADAPAPWLLPPWPPVVPDAIVADPIPDCRRCGRPRVIPGQPGRPGGLCYPCWLKAK